MQNGRGIWLKERLASYRECWWREFESGVSDHDGYLARVLRQLRHVVGGETILEILADYRSDFGGSAADTDDFANVASTTAGTDLIWFLDQWVYQIGAPQYLYAWNSVYVDGQEFIVLHLEQIQDASFPDVFIVPVDIEARTNFNSVETVTV